MMRDVVTRSDAPSRSDISLDDMEKYRRELTGYCYRMLGSSFEAEDAVQETFVRAWKALDSFEGRSSLRSWLYRIATNTCTDMLRSVQRRARPMDFGPSSTADTPVGPPTEEYMWVTPIADGKVLPDHGDPAELAEGRETIRLAFIAALQELPAKQRAVLILREVLRWQATEVAELLDTSVASVNSALQRARATLAAKDQQGPRSTPKGDDADLIAGYVEAFESYDVTKLVSLLHEDALMSMPPFELYVQGADEIGRWFVGQGSGCEGSRLLAIQANGSWAFASYRPDGQGGHAPWSIQVIETDGERIVGQHSFLALGEPRLFASFDLPDHLPPGWEAPEHLRTA